MGAQGDGNDLGGMVELYPHDPLTLLPLLESHLPYSLPVYGLIKSSFVSSRTVPDNDITPTTTDVSSNPPSYISSVAWLTFPPSSLPIPPEVWTVIIHLPYPMSRQTRLFNSLEPLLTVLPSSTASSSTIPSDSSSHSPISSTHPSTLPSTQPQFQQWKLGQNQVSNVIRKMTQKNAVMQIVGALSVLWAESVRLEFGTEAHKICDNWMAPDLSHSEKHDVQSGQESHDGKDGQDGKDGSSRIQGARVSKDGLAVDVGRREDCEMIQQTRDIKEDIEYYFTRIPHTTVIRPIRPITDSAALSTSNPPNAPTATPAVAWILTHAAGDLGALYTLPQYRRRHLAHWLVATRLEITRVHGYTAFVWVMRGNEASEALWKGMGWKRGWGVEWVYTR